MPTKILRTSSAREQAPQVSAVAASQTLSTIQTQATHTTLDTQTQATQTTFETQTHAEQSHEHGHQVQHRL